jgi:hypothetical protein
MEDPMTRALPLLLAAGCVPLSAPRDVTGNYEATYVDDLRVFLDDQLVADVASGEDAAIEWDGQVFHVTQLCSDEGVDCPGETYWRTVGVDQPWGPSQGLLNFVDLDQERGVPGQRLGGTMADDGSFTMLSGLDLSGNDACAQIGVGTVLGTFTATNDAIEGGVVAYEWSGGCEIAGVGIGAKLRLETDYTAVRTGDLDLSSVEADPPVTTSGAETADASTP